MVKIRNYGVGTGWSKSGITGKKTTFKHDEKIYAEHVWDDLFDGAALKIRWQRKVAGAWKTEHQATWVNPGYNSAYSYAWIRNYPSGKWRAEFTCSVYGPYYKEFTIKEKPVEEAPAPPEPEPPEEEYPKDVIRDPYRIEVYNATQEAAAKEFLGIEPEGLALDDWLAKKDKAGLEQWKNYWTDRFSKIGMSYWIDFVNDKYNEYIDQLPEPGSQLVEVMKESFGDAYNIIKFLPNAGINLALTTLLKTGFRDLLEGFAEYLGNKFIDEYPEYKVLKEAPSGSVSITAIIGILGAILGFGTLINWLRKELPEPTGMAVWAAIEARDWETANDANQQYIKFINSMHSWWGVALGWLNPLIATFMNEQKDSQLAQADAFQSLIDEGLKEEEVKKGRLVITPDPSDAKVSVSGQIPTTGTFEKELPVKSYDYTVSKFRYKSKSGTVKITADEVKEISVEIEEIEEVEVTKGILNLSVSPFDAQVSVADHPEIDSPGSYELEEGTYTISVTKDGFYPEDSKAIIEAEKTTNISITLTEKPEKKPPEEVKGTLIIKTDPEGAEISIAGFPDITSSGEYELPSGSYDVKCSMEGYISQTKKAFVSEEKNTVVAFLLESEEKPEEIPSKATVKIISTPTNADVYIDGEYKFTTTPYTLTLDAGSYIMRVQKDEYFPQEAMITVGEGDEITIPFELQELPEEVKPTVEYISQQEFTAPVSPPEIRLPSPYLTETPVRTLPDYKQLPPAFVEEYEEVEAPRAREKEVLINIETTDLNSWEGKIFSIAWLDLSLPSPEPKVMSSNDEQGLLRAFLSEFKAKGFTKIIGYNLRFDYQYLFNKFMLYRIRAEAFYKASMRDVYQLMSQIKEEFVFNARSKGKLDDYAKELLGKGKYSSQEDLLRRYVEGDFSFVDKFQIRQLEITKGLYDLFKYCASEGFLKAETSTPASYHSPETIKSEETHEEVKEKPCPNCEALNPMDAETCAICGHKF